MTVTSAMPSHSRAIHQPDLPLDLSCAVDDSPSGMLLIAIAATIGMLRPPCSTDRPMTIDSGMPSISAPIAMTTPLPPAARRATMFAVSVGVDLDLRTPRARDEPVGHDVDDRAAEEAEHRGEEAAVIGRLLDELVREGRDEHAGAERHDGRNDHLRDPDEPRHGGSGEERAAGDQTAQRGEPQSHAVTLAARRTLARQPRAAPAVPARRSGRPSASR